MEITALMENTAGREDLLSEHGLSLLVVYNGTRVLFDCGQSGQFLENARRMGVSLEGLDAVVLSHSHYDHARGYRELVDAGLAAPVLYTGAGFFEPKHSLELEDFSDRSCGFDRCFIREKRIRHREVASGERIAPGMWVLSDFSKKTAFETVPEKFHRKTDRGYCRDDFRDEVCLAMEGKDEIVLVVGCAHPGIVNMVREAAARLGKGIRAVYGGIHLKEADRERMEQTLDALAEAGVKTLGFCHCSGAAVEAMVESDPRFQGCHLGSGNSEMIHF